MDDKSVVSKKEVQEEVNHETDDVMAIEDIEIEELAVDGICGVY